MKNEHDLDFYNVKCCYDYDDNDYNFFDYK
jgi:hypothetical protein